LTDNGDMVTQQQLADMLAGVNVEDVARAANVSTKTIYRLRHMQHSPTLGTVEKILGAIAVVKAQESSAEPAREAA
jgi:DNA-binding phage protein